MVTQAARLLFGALLGKMHLVNSDSWRLSDDWRGSERARERAKKRSLLESNKWRVLMKEQLLFLQSHLIERIASKASPFVGYRGAEPAADADYSNPSHRTQCEVGSALWSGPSAPAMRPSNRSKDPYLKVNKKTKNIKRYLNG